MKWIFSFFVGAVTLFAAPSVTVSILPQKYFVEQIAGDTVDVNVMVLPGNSPATYEPKPSQMANLEKSDLYFAIGVPYEKVWVPKFKKQYPKLPIVKTQDGIKKIPMAAHHHDEAHEHEGHDHEDEAHEHEGHDHDAHEHEGHDHSHKTDMLDPHVWLDPILVKTQAKNIAQALSEKYPKNASLYEKNLGNFLASLDTIDADIRAILKPVKFRKFMVYHPAWGYFAKRYNLVQEAAEIEGKEPKPKELQELIEEAKEEKIHTIFVQPQFSKKSANLIAKAIGGKVVSINPLEEDWRQGLITTAKAFVGHLK